MKTPRQCIKLEEPQRQLLEQWVRAHSTPQQVARRCRIILQSAEGKSDKAIAMELDINRHTCRLWRERFVECGVDCLWEVEAGRGAQVRSWFSSENHRRHSALQARRANTLEHAQNGQGAGSPSQHCGANLAGARTQTSPTKDLQTLT